jgi:hypothetical protein
MTTPMPLYRVRIDTAALERPPTISPVRSPVPSQAAPAVNSGGTQPSDKVACGCTSTRCAGRHGEDGCGALKRRSSKTCLPCYRANVGTTARKYEAAEHAKMLARMLTSAGRRARADDPGQGLAMLLEVQRRVDDLVKAVGAEVLAAYLSEFPDGLSAMAADLSLGTGEPWSKQRVWKRWAAKLNGQVTPPAEERSNGDD